MSGLTVEGLTGPYLKAAGFSLAPGEAVAVMGPSGAGKSVLLRAIADLDPNEGAVALDGAARRAMPAPAWRRRVMFMAAEPGWWAEQAGDHFTEHAAAAAALAEKLGLAKDTLDKPVAVLSTGERQRLALIRLLVREPTVMLLDEPTAALDDRARAAVEAMLRDFLAKGGAILFTTHDAAQAKRLARRCLRVEGGTVTEAAL